MRPAMSPIVLSALILTTPVAVTAATSLRSIMHAWRADSRRADAMLRGRAAFDEAAIRAILQAYVDDAGRVAARADGRSAEARDFRQRFVIFQADAQTALGDLTERPKLRADFSRISSECRSCHGKFNT